MFRLAGPLMVVFAGGQLMSLVDTIIVGHMGAVELAAVGLGGSLFIFVGIFGIGITVALDPLAAQAIGAGDPVAAKRHLLHTSAINKIITIPSCVLIVAIVGLTSLFVDDAAVMKECFLYVVGRLPGLLPLLLFITYRSYLQALGSTREAMLAVLAANVLNVPLSVGLAFGDRVIEPLFGVSVGLGDGLGPLGVGIATSLVTLWEAHYVYRAIKKRPDPGDAGPIGWAGMKTVLKLGIPSGFHLLAEIGVFTATCLAIGIIGTVSLAAHQVALGLASMTFTICLGVSSATSTRVGFAVGRRRLDETRRSGWVGILFSTLIMGIFGTIFMIFPETLASWITTKPEIIAAAIPLIQIAAVFQVSDGLQSVAGGAIRGAGDTKSPMLVNIIGHWGIGLPCGLLLAFVVMNQRPVTQTAGMWWGLTIGLTLVAVWLSLTFYRKTRTLVVPVVDED